ncbi:MAG: hypothetical protein K0U34_02165 [Alphaproteobacteria bacterium]|nr:hypothetical protein [Alphaproteobacteria bacterium]
MGQTEQPLASRVVRTCARCNAATMLNVAPDQPSSAAASDDLNTFQCTKCGETLKLWGLKESILGIVVFGGLLSLLLARDHLFWLLLHLLANPLQEFPAMAKDGPLAPILIPLGLIAFNILLVGLPLMGLGIILHATWVRVRNPVAPSADADVALEGHTFKPQDPPRQWTWQEFFRSVKIAGTIHIGFIAVAWLALTFADHATFEAIVEGALPGLLLSGGVLFGVRRWMVATVWVVFLPLSGFIIALLIGQLS